MHGQLKSLWYMVCFLQCASDKHFHALWDLCSRDKPSTSLLNKPEKAFFSSKKGMIPNCNPDMHLKLEAWIYFVCTDPHNSWKDLRFLGTNKGWPFVCPAFLLSQLLLQFAHNKASLACATLSAAVRTSLPFVKASDTSLLNVLLLTGYCTSPTAAKGFVLVNLVTQTDVCHLCTGETLWLAGQERSDCLNDPWQPCSVVAVPLCSGSQAWGAPQYGRIFLPAQAKPWKWEALFTLPWDSRHLSFLSFSALSLLILT